MGGRRDRCDDPGNGANDWKRDDIDLRLSADGRREPDTVLTHGEVRPMFGMSAERLQ